MYVSICKRTVLLNTNTNYNAFTKPILSFTNPTKLFKRKNFDKNNLMCIIQEETFQPGILAKKF